MNKIDYSRVPNKIRSLLNRIDVRSRHVEQTYYDEPTKIYRIVLKEKYRMGSDAVVLTAENLRYLYREDYFEGIGSPDRREGMVLLFSNP